jgi:hypothetical protein
MLTVDPSLQGLRGGTSADALRKGDATQSLEGSEASSPGWIAPSYWFDRQIRQIQPRDGQSARLSWPSPVTRLSTESVDQPETRAPLTCGQGWWGEATVLEEVSVPRNDGLGVVRPRELDEVVIAGIPQKRRRRVRIRDDQCEGAEHRRNREPFFLADAARKYRPSSPRRTSSRSWSQATISMSPALTASSRSEGWLSGLATTAESSVLASRTNRLTRRLDEPREPPAPPVRSPRPR